jgi:hypothetical protein
MVVHTSLLAFAGLRFAGTGLEFLVHGTGYSQSNRQAASDKANPPRGGDAKPRVSDLSVANGGLEG